MKRVALAAALALAVIAAAPEQETEHRVVAGETLHGIANRAGVSREAIIAANRLEPPYTVRIGQVLAIPRTRRHRVAAGETPFALAWRYGVSWQDIAVANGFPPGAALRRGQQLLIPSVIPPPREKPDAGSAAPARRFTWPLVGTVRRSFARSGAKEHPGLDVLAPAGTPVRAAAAGRVIFAGEEPQQYGKLVVLDHGGGWHSAYGFLSRATVREGDAVKAGERVGLVGRTGQAARDELHFELRRDNRPVDPAPLLPDRD